MLMRSEVPNILTRRQDQASVGGCPNGGKWYACASNSFVGCCTVNPCTDVGCAAGNLRAASLGDLPYGSVADQDCLSGGLFYTCTGPPPFWGCCKSAPCGVGCAAENLTQAYLKPGKNTFLGANAQATSAPSGSGGSSTPTGAIIGGVVGGVLGLALIVILIWWIRRKKLSREVVQSPSVPMAYNPHGQQADPGPNVPLTYPEVVDHYAGTSPQPTKQNFPPSAFTSPALPQYNDRRMSHELGGSNESVGLISPMTSPGFQDQQHGYGHGSRPISYELHGSGSPGMPPKGMHTPSIMSTAVSELPAEDMRYSQVSSQMRYSNQPPASPPPQPPSSENNGLGLSMPGRQ